MVCICYVQLTAALELRKSYATGYAMLAASAISTAGLLML